MNIVYATANTSIGHNGVIWRLQAGQAWNADDPVVKAHPEAFHDFPPFVRTSLNRDGVERVEQATATPGQKRKSGR